MVTAGIGRGRETEMLVDFSEVAISVRGREKNFKRRTRVRYILDAMLNHKKKTHTRCS